ncbi:tyrosine-type recombinase/integrase [Saccharopolyspora hattusasensis]|uniref:tyrosine-type recombinase/integrase n=1 Tax=Saccharopolyspora hattusasensis TaxID=1128679 RepID=UPI003D95C907
MAVPADAAHVLGAGCDVGPTVARLVGMIDPAFLAEAGWDAVTRVLSLPSEHPQLGWRMCQTQGCGNQVYGHDRTCGMCRTSMASPEDHQGGGAVEGVVPLQPGRLCQVEACGRARRNRRYCRAHDERWRDQRRTDPGFDERRWRRIEPAIEGAGQVSLHGIPALVVAEVLYGLQQRTRDGALTGTARLRQIAWELRREQPVSLAGSDLNGRGDQHKVLRCFVRHVQRAFRTPETERVKDVWDLAVFGLPGRLTFTQISQAWLREAAKRWAADDLPRRRGKNAAGPAHHYLTSLASLSESLRATRTDHGNDPAVLGRGDIDAFLQRMAFLAAEGQLSTDARTRRCREVRQLLVRFRALGLTRAGGPAAGLGDDFALVTSDIPQKPEDPEPNRDLPAEILRQLCDHLPALEHSISCREIRVAVELIMDTGRRPDEICALPWDCLEYDEDRLPVLVYDNHKNARIGRRLPIAQATADLISEQKDHVRTRFPDTMLAELKLLPAAYANPHGRRAITENQLGARHRAWIDSLPSLLRTDGTEYDKARIVPYAYRHSYAQRHADAGVPIDVLGSLLNHVSLNTTKGYYRVGGARRREAVDRVATMQFDRHGNRIWRQAQQLLDSERARRAIGEVAVPFGICAEPSNVKAGGQSCPFRFRCAGCDHFRTDVSYLPDLQAYLDDLLRNRERVLAASDIDDWARAEAMPSDDEIGRIRRLIARITTGLDELTATEREHLEQAVTVVRRHRAVMLGMPRIRQALPDLRPERTA